MPKLQLRSILAPKAPSWRFYSREMFEAKRQPAEWFSAVFPAGRRVSLREGRLRQMIREKC